MKLRMTYLTSVFMNFVCISRYHAVAVLGALAFGLYGLAGDYTFSRTLVVFLIWFLPSVVFMSTYCRVSDTLVYFKGFNYLMMTVKDRRAVSSYNYTESAGRQAISLYLLKETLKGFNLLIEEINPSRLTFTTHDQILRVVLKHKKIKAQYDVSHVDADLKPLAAEACVLSHLKELKAFQQAEPARFEADLFSRRQFHHVTLVRH